MPSTPVVHDVSLDIQQPQAKFCSLCHSALSDATFHLLADALVCPACRDGIRSTRQTRQPNIPPSSPDQRPYRLVVDGAANVYHHLRAHPSHEVPSVQTTRRVQENNHSQSSQQLDAQFTQQQQSPSTAAVVTNSPPACQSASGGHAASSSLGPAVIAERPFQHLQLPPLTIGASLLSSGSSGSTANRAHASPASNHSGAYYTPTPSPLVQQSRRPQHTLARSYASDPLVDITRLRVRSQVHQCLYPGATFEGTQKSGRNSYDVTVTVVDVDFSMSTLCGYLRIRGLTEDWPELTTYFDAEIIGPRYGFRTLNWGASENEDQVHWARFPAYKHVRPEAKGPHMTIDERDRGAVFMRWKERFLVPDHRVHDINGASFAGFYYVCVDFNSLHGTAAVDDDEAAEASISPSDKDSRRRRGSSAAPNRSNRSKSRPRVAPLTPPVATMSGFYYHQNSEPYQQLSLTHIAESTSSSFEFR